MGCGNGTATTHLDFVWAWAHGGNEMIGRMSRFVLLVAFIALAVPQAVFANQAATPVVSGSEAETPTATIPLENSVQVIADCSSITVYISGDLYIYGYVEVNGTVVFEGNFIQGSQGNHFDHIFSDGEVATVHLGFDDWPATTSSEPVSGCVTTTETSIAQTPTVVATDPATTQTPAPSHISVFTNCFGYVYIPYTLSEPKDVTISLTADDHTWSQDVTLPAGSSTYVQNFQAERGEIGLNVELMTGTVSDSSGVIATKSRSDCTAVGQMTNVTASCSGSFSYDYSFTAETTVWFGFYTTDQVYLGDTDSRIGPGSGHSSGTITNPEALIGKDVVVFAAWFDPMYGELGPENPVSLGICSQIPPTQQPSTTPQPTATHVEGGTVVIQIAEAAILDGSIPAGADICLESGDFQSCQVVPSLLGQGTGAGIARSRIAERRPLQSSDMVTLTFTNVPAGTYDIVLRVPGRDPVTLGSVSPTGQGTVYVELQGAATVTPAMTPTGTTSEPTATTASQTQTPAITVAAPTAEPTGTAATASSLPNTGVGGSGSSAVIAALLAILALIFSGAALATRRR